MGKKKGRSPKKVILELKKKEKKSKLRKQEIEGHVRQTPPPLPALRLPSSLIKLKLIKNRTKK